MSLVNFGIGGSRVGLVPIGQNIKYVTQESDFGTVTPGSHIDVAADTYFILNAPVTQTLPFIIPDNSTMGIKTTNRFFNTLTYNNNVDAQFQGNNASLALLDVILDGSTTGTMFDINNGVYSLKFPDFIDYDSLGTITDAVDIYMPGLFCDIINNGLSIVNAVTATITEGAFVLNSGNAFSLFNVLGGNTGKVQIFDNLVDNDTNASLINVDSATFGNDSRLTAARNRLDNPDLLFASGSLKPDDVRILADVNQGAKNSAYIGGFFDNDNTNITTISVSDTFTDLNISATASPVIERFTLTNATNGLLTYNGLETLRATVSVQITASKTTNLEQYSFAVTRNGTPLTDRQVAAFEVKTTKDSLSMAVPVTLVTDDTVKIQVRGEGHSDNLTIDAINVTIR